MRIKNWAMDIVVENYDKIKGPGGPRFYKHEPSGQYLEVKQWGIPDETVIDIKQSDELPPALKAHLDGDTASPEVRIARLEDALWKMQQKLSEKV